MRWLAGGLAIALLACGGESDEDAAKRRVGDALMEVGDDLACDLYADLAQSLERETPDNETIAVRLDLIAASAQDEEFKQQVRDAAAEVRGGELRGPKFDALAESC